MDKFLKQKVIELALKHNLTQREIIDMFYSQFKMTTEVMKEDSTKPSDQRRSVKIKHIGEFRFSPDKLEKMELNKQKKYGKTLAESTSEDRKGTGTDETLQ